MRKSNIKSGISLIVLVITIIIMIILAGAVIYNITDTNIVDTAKSAEIENNYKSYEEVLNTIVLNQISFENGNAITIKQAIESEIENAEVTGQYGYTLTENSNYLKVAITQDKQRYLFTLSIDGEIVRGAKDELTEKEATDMGFEYDISSSYPKIISYSGTSKDIAIPSKIGGISIRDTQDATFWNNKVIENVVVSEGITGLGGSCFGWCTSIKNVELPKTLLRIRNGAFGGCTGIKNIVIPKSVHTCMSGVFLNWTSEQTINVYWKEGEKPDGWSDITWKCNAKINYLVK